MLFIYAQMTKGLGFTMQKSLLNVQSVNRMKGMWRMKPTWWGNMEPESIVWTCLGNSGGSFISVRVIEKHCDYWCQMSKKIGLLLFLL